MEIPELETALLLNTFIDIGLGFEITQFLTGIRNLNRRLERRLFEKRSLEFFNPRTDGIFMYKMSWKRLLLESEFPSFMLIKRVFGVFHFFNTI